MTSNTNTRTPYHSDIADEDIELENLRSYHKNGQMLLAGTSDEGMIEKLAAVLRATQTNLVLASEPSMKGLTRSYFELPESKQAELKIMVRAVLGTLLNEFPALNMQVINRQLEMLESSK